MNEHTQDDIYIRQVKNGYIITTRSYPWGSAQDEYVASDIDEVKAVIEKILLYKIIDEDTKAS